ncbi:unnamed protein product, partial [Amoebophrya sp. A120]|eukprot:GSA120T00026164001.1
MSTGAASPSSTLSSRSSCPGGTTGGASTARRKRRKRAAMLGVVDETSCRMVVSRTSPTSSCSAERRATTATSAAASARTAPARATSCANCTKMTASSSRCSGGLHDREMLSRDEQVDNFHRNDCQTNGRRKKPRRGAIGRGGSTFFLCASRGLLQHLLPVLSLLVATTASATNVGRQFYDPDCVREDPFWTKYLNLVSDAVAKNEPPDYHVSRYALQIPGCPLGKLVACVGAESMDSVRDCFYHIPTDFYLLMSSQWPVLKLLDIEQQKIWDSVDSATGKPTFLEDDNADDCILSPDPNVIEWNEFRGALATGVTEANEWLLEKKTKTDRTSLGWAISHADGVIFKSQSSVEHSATSSTISDVINQCPFGVIAANALRMFAILLSDGDVYRMLERGFQQIEQIWNRKHQLLYSRWRLFGIVHLLNEMKKQKLDLPEAALTDDLDSPPKYMDSKNPWDWRVGDMGLYTE